MLKNVLLALAVADRPQNEFQEWHLERSQQGGEFHMTASAVGFNRIKGSHKGDIDFTFASDREKNNLEIRALNLWSDLSLIRFPDLDLYFVYYMLY